MRSPKNKHLGSRAHAMRACHAPIWMDRRRALHHARACRGRGPHREKTEGTSGAEGRPYLRLHRRCAHLLHDGRRRRLGGSRSSRLACTLHCNMTASSSSSVCTGRFGAPFSFSPGAAGRPPREVDAGRATQPLSVWTWGALALRDPRGLKDSVSFHSKTSAGPYAAPIPRASAVFVDEEWRLL